MGNLEVLIEENKLQEKIKELGKIITKEYNTDRELVVLCILKGAMYFCCDLTKNIKRDLVLDFMKVASYSGTESTGKIDIQTDLREDINGKDVLIVEDIIDTGLTLSKLKEYLQEKNPNSIKIATLLDKKCRRKEKIYPDYYGFEVGDEFVVGYGLDYDEKYRNLPYIGFFK